VKKILVVDDEKNITDIVAYNLRKEGYEVICAYDGETGFELALSEKPELILLDLMLPKLDGFDVCRKLREKNIQTPIIMLTARAEEVDKVVGFELGADDYVTKPFGNRELLARVKSHLRRRDPAKAGSGSNKQTYSDLTIDNDRCEITRRGEVLPLTPLEFEIICFLASQSNQVFSRETMLEKIWGYNYFGNVRTVDVTIRRLRAKIEENPEKPRYILTKRGFGYYFGGSGGHNG